MSNRNPAHSSMEHDTPETQPSAAETPQWLYDAWREALERPAVRAGVILWASTPAASQRVGTQEGGAQ